MFPLLRNPDVASPLRKVILVASTLYISRTVANPELAAALIGLVVALLQAWSKYDDTAIKKTATLNAWDAEPLKKDTP